MRDLFGAVTRRVAERGVVYLARKSEALKKVRNFACEFAFRDQGRLIRVYSRPGVFSHRRIDAGARQVLNAMEVREGDKVLDVGCGSGVLGLAAALRAPGVEVLAVDSNARAVECTGIGARANGLANLRTELNASGDYPGPGTFQLALANPPYYAAFQIARHFLQSAAAALAPGGRIVVVAKFPEWYEEHAPEWFEQVEIEPSKEYWIIRGVKRRP
jgi:16S rRNA (guanine1207-N2)-methyltransferase